MDRLSRLPWLLAAIAVALIASFTALGVTLFDRKEGERGERGAPGSDSLVVNARVPVESQVRVPIPGTQRTKAATVDVPAASVLAVEETDAGRHEDLRSESPPGVEPSVLERGRMEQEVAAQRDNLPVTPPLAAPVQGGCLSRFNTVNYSSRRGLAPRALIFHYTVSPNVAGIRDVQAVAAFLNRSSTSASSNFIIDREGNCFYTVREVDKAWTQGAFNPWAISIEIVNSGREGSLISGAGRAKLVRVSRDIVRRWKIPASRLRVSGCRPLGRGGIGTHQQLGVCGGGHVDVSPYDAEVSRIIREVAAPVKARTHLPRTAVERRICARTRSGSSEVRSAARRSAARRHLRCR